MSTETEALLAKLRAAVNVIEQADAHQDAEDDVEGDWPTEEEIADAQRQLFSAFEELDDRLTRGGGLPKDWSQHQLAIAAVQRQVALVWTLAGYAPAFCACTLPTRDFGHALGHVQKAAGRLFEVVDAHDHGRADEPPQVGKYLADLVICAARMASTAPGGEVDLAAAVRERLAEIAARETEAADVGRPDR